MVKKIIAITFIFTVTSVAWMILGASTGSRTYNQTEKLSEQVEGLWGSVQTQEAPTFYYEKKRKRTVEKSEADEKGRQVKKFETVTETIINKVNAESGEVRADFDLTHRKKGLLWYDTYRVAFHSTYEVRNPLPRKERFKIDFQFPARDAIYDDFRFVINGRPVEINDFSEGKITVPFDLREKETGRIEIGYVSQGMDKWFYKFGEGVTRVKNFKLAMTTNFADIDFPQDTISPTSKERTGAGWKLLWKYNDLVSGFRIGMDMPNKINPGPLASQISFFAPVSLLFFYFVVFMISEIRGVRIHPMNYLFLAAAFFAFHLLFSYTVDHIALIPAFIIASAVSLFLVVSYMRIVVGARFASIEVGFSQFVFLILFSLAHFFQGYTGLTVTIGAIITLFVMMQLTAKIDWEEKFRQSRQVAEERVKAAE